ncbi:carboxypeptidase regulatory-like domain-containing protein [Bacteroidia bacterium]|nr:carboxypeptidase regulatory-like domain-containing protein [Bacteroidia bacterium]
MKHYIFTSILTLTAVVLFPQISLAQSISGNVKDLSATIDLGYANIDIYQGEELVASVLADKEGNFNVELDTGTYRAEIVYAGYKKISQQIRVKSDESVDFNLAEDMDSKYKPVKVKETVEEKADYSDYDGDGVGYFMDASPESPETITRGATTSVKPARSALMMKRSAPRGIPARRPVIPQQGVAGKLTAGEINDFSKWDLWGDLADGEFAQYSQLWSYSVSNRYMVQLTDKKGLPLADATVQLVDKEGVSYYFARTDNTGKAELWASISGRDFKKNKFSIVGNYQGESFGIRKAKTIANGINTIDLNVACTQSQKVDIAFVVDATGSMSDELNYLTAELNDVIYKSKEISATLNFSFANVFYRDRGDAYLTQQQDFTRVLSESVSFISQQQAGGGGDFEEAVEVALDTAVNTLQWSEDARARILFLILDAPPHNTPEIQEKLKRVSRQAAEKGIRIVPLVASGINKGTEYLMRSIALATNGTYAFLTDDSGIGGSHLKPSTDTYKVETLNDLLVRVIKSYTYMPNCEQELPDLNLNYPADSITYTPVNTTLTDTSSVVTNSTNPKDISWTYYPNPTRGIVNIKASVDIPELYITDLSGKVLQVVSNLKKQNIQRIDLSSYASGIYLIRYPIGKQWLSGKVILKR